MRGKPQILQKDNQQYLNPQKVAGCPKPTPTTLANKQTALMQTPDAPRRSLYDLFTYMGPFRSRRQYTCHTWSFGVRSYIQMI